MIPTTEPNTARLPYSRELATSMIRAYGLHRNTWRKWATKGWIPATPATWATQRQRKLQSHDETTRTLRIIFIQPDVLLNAKALGRLLEKKHRIPQLAQDFRGDRLPRHVLRSEESAIIASHLDSLAARFGLAAQVLREACLHTVDTLLIEARLRAIIGDDTINVRALIRLCPPGSTPIIRAIQAGDAIPVLARTLPIYAGLAAQLVSCQRLLMGVAPASPCG